MTEEKWGSVWNGHYFDITRDGGPYSQTVAIVHVNYTFNDTRDAACKRANLIAASPELLEVLKELADYHSADLTSDFGNEAGRMRKALAAIAKAEGRSND